MEDRKKCTFDERHSGNEGRTKGRKDLKEETVGGRQGMRKLHRR